MKKSNNMFLNCNATKPWWYSDNNFEIVQKQKSFDAAQSLDKKLPLKINQKKIKI